MATLATIYIGNTHYIKLEGVVNANNSTDYSDDSATVTAQVYTAAGASVTGASCTLTYISGSDGNFIGYLSDDITLTADGDYTVRILIDDGTNKKARWDLKAIAKYRR